MLGKERVEEILDLVMRLSDADQIEAVLLTEDSLLTRFSHSSIHQNVATSEALLNIRVINGRRCGYAATNRLNPISIKDAIKRAMEFSHLQAEDPHPITFPKRMEATPIHTLFRATQDHTPSKKGDEVLSLVRQASKHRLSAFGSYLTEIREIGVANTNGVMEYAALSLASIKVIMRSDGSSGYASSISRDIHMIDPLRVGELAIERCLKAKEPKEIPPGRYDVVLEEEAVGTILGILGYIGFGAMSFQEGRSFMCGRIGEKIVDEGVSIWDDGLDEKGLAMPFDFEGVPKKKVVLIEDGIAKGVVYDHYTASKEGKASTGHALPQPNTIGPIPLNLFMKEGKLSKEELIESVSYGLLITRFHYTNVVDPFRTVITGMTRDGLFLIENGEVKGALRNMRFTESILEILGRLDGISKERRLVSGGMLLGLGSCLVPSIKVKDFNFTGVTEF
jgi:predicted Zn-dependent protease